MWSQQKERERILALVLQQIGRWETEIEGSQGIRGCRCQVVALQCNFHFLAVCTKGDSIFKKKMSESVHHCVGVSDYHDHNELMSRDCSLNL